MNPENHDGGQQPEDALSFFEEQLLDQWDYIGCGFDVHFTCSHEISVEWCSNSGSLSSETDEEDEDDHEDVDFVLQCEEVAENAGNGVLVAPERVRDIRGLAVSLLAKQDYSSAFQLLIQHGWQFEDADVASGPGPELAEVIPRREGWDIDTDLNGDFSGIAIVTDPSGVVHEVELPEADFEDFSDNFHITDDLDALHLFEDNPAALEALRKLF